MRTRLLFDVWLKHRYEVWCEAYTERVRCLGIMAHFSLKDTRLFISLLWISFEVGFAVSNKMEV
jgi:hypothetical protein